MYTILSIDGACMLIIYYIHVRMVLSSYIEKLVIGLAVGVNSVMLVIVGVLIAVLIVLWWKTGLLKLYINIKVFTGNLDLFFNYM